MQLSLVPVKPQLEPIKRFLNPRNASGAKAYIVSARRKLSLPRTGRTLALQLCLAPVKPLKNPEWLAEKRIVVLNTVSRLLNLRNASGAKAHIVSARRKLSRLVQGGR